jgi:protein-disulfide isomerase
VGGASRNEKKRRQEVAAQRLAAAGITPPKRSTDRSPLLIVGTVVLVALLVGLGVLYYRGAGNSVTPTYATSAAGAVVTVGPPSAPVTVDVYEDYLCSGCERFENRYGDELTTALNAGQITVRYHSVAILDNRTDPPGYSTRAANAALCAVPAGIFPTYHDRLFAEQPAELGAGSTDDQLVAWGTELGAEGDFEACVRSGANTAAIAAETRTAESTPALQNAEGRFATPAVVVDGRKVDLNDTSWLQDAIAAG